MIKDGTMMADRFSFDTRHSGADTSIPRRAARLGVILGALSAGLFILGATAALPPDLVGPWARDLRLALFGRLAAETGLISFAAAWLAFRKIIAAYRRITGFPWAAALVFGTAAINVILALHACLN